MLGNVYTAFPVFDNYFSRGEKSKPLYNHFELTDIYISRLAAGASVGFYFLGNYFSTRKC